MNEFYIPLILALTEVTKKIGIDVKWSPILAMIFGAIISGLSAGFNTDSIIQGIVWGLASSGLWSGGKTLGKAVLKSAI